MDDPDLPLSLPDRMCNAGTVFTGRELREHRDAVRCLGRHVDDALPGLRTALVWSVAARRSAASV